MIIRPICKKEFVALPNSLFNDRRLSADTRAMLSLLMSKPPGWQLRPAALCKLLSREGEPVGWTRLKRMFTEATDAGYMARSAKQAHNEDGTWGKYDYIIGMPDDVARPVAKADVALLPQRRDAQKDGPYSANEDANHKRQSSEKTNLINHHHHDLLSSTLGEAAKRWPTEAKTPKRRRAFEGPEVVQHRIAVRLGLGDVIEGW